MRVSSAKLRLGHGFKSVGFPAEGLCAFAQLPENKFELALPFTAGSVIIPSPSHVNGAQDLHGNLRCDGDAAFLGQLCQVDVL